MSVGGESAGTVNVELVIGKAFTVWLPASGVEQTFTRGVPVPVRLDDLDAVRGVMGIDVHGAPAESFKIHEYPNPNSGDMTMADLAGSGGITR